MKTLARRGSGRQSRRSVSGAHGAHERQARRAGETVRRGQRVSSTRLTPAPAATFDGGASRAEPLSTAVRVDLEQAFDADLSAVRLHHDAAAHTFVRESGARAFTAGADVYFGAGRFAPSTPGGLALLAHEIAHVIQQTGRTTHDGRLGASQASGPGTIQRDDDPFADDLVPFLSSGTEALTALASRHGKSPDADETLKALIALVTTMSGGDLPRKTASVVGAALIGIAVAGEFTETVAGTDVTRLLTIPAKGFLVDCLKVCGLDEHFEAAATVLTGDTTHQVRAAFGPRKDFRDFLLRERGEDWVAGAFAHPALRPLWPHGFLHAYKQYLLNPGRPRQALSNLLETRKRELANLNGDTADLMVSDRVAMAFDLLTEYDASRMLLLKLADEEFEKPGMDRDKVRQRLMFASAAPLGLQAIRNFPGRGRIWADMVDRMIAMARQAAVFWDTLLTLRAGYDQEMAAAGMDSVTGLLPSIKRVFVQDDPLFKPLRVQLQSLSAPGGLYGLDATGMLTTVPTAVEYERRMGRFADALGVRGNPDNNVLLVLQQQLLRLHDADAQNLGTDQAKAIGLAIWWLMDLKLLVGEYSAGKDHDAKRGFTDLRLHHRLRVATEVRRFSQVAGWADTLEPARRILQGDDVTTSYLATRGAWSVLDSVSADQMPVDFNNVPIFENFAISADNVARFFHAETLQAMSDAIYRHLNAVETGKAKLGVKDVNKAIAESGRPWKCRPDDATLILKPSELALVKGQPNPKRPSMYSLINASAKAKGDLGVLAKERKLGPGFYWAARKDEIDDVYAWIFPDVVRLIAMLRLNEPFATISTREGLDSLSDEKWMEAIHKHLGTEETRKKLDARILEYAQGEETGAEHALREFTILNRRDKRKSIAGELIRYSKGRNFKNILIPREVVESVDRLRSEVRPLVDARAQTSMLLLSLGPELDAAFDTVDHAVKVPPFFHRTLTEVVEFADNELASAIADPKGVFAKSLRPLLYRNSNSLLDESFDDFMKHRDLVATVAQRVDEARNLLQEDMGFTSKDGVTLRSLSFYPELKPGRAHAFEMNGEEWELVTVHQPFIYHPPLKSSAPTLKSSKPLLTDLKGNELPIDGTPLVSFLVNGLEYDLARSDTKQLSDLSDHLAAEGFRREMENLAEGLETGAMILMDAVELVPGVGQELMIARLTASTAAFLKFELPLIADALKGDPIEHIKEIGSKLASEHLTIENFVKFILLGSPVKAPFADVRGLRKEKDFSKRKPHGKLGRMIAMLRKLGIRLADALQWLQIRLRAPMQAFRSAVATRPRLGWLLRKAVDVAAWLRTLVPPTVTQEAADKSSRTLAVLQELVPVDAEQPPNTTPQQQDAHARGLIGQVEDQLKSAGETFKGELQEKLDVLREAQLPSEVVPLSKLAEFVLDFFLSRLGAKVRIAKSLLQHTTPYQELEHAIGKAVAAEARDTVLDPNKHWREQILTKIDAQFIDARNQLVDAVYGLTDTLANETGLPVFRLERPEAATTTSFTVERTPFPEEELELAPRVEGEVPATGTLAELPTSAGQPLAVRVRVAEEARFGHEFTHVRLHEGQETRDPLEALGADAATAGSHIFLRPGLTATGGRGARLLRHELTPVLQQTGERALGESHDERPVRGRRGRGLVLDDMREAAARFMAETDAAASRGAVDVDAGAEGIQPSLDTVAVDLLKTLTQIGPDQPSTGKVDTKDPAVLAGLGTWTNVQRRLSQDKASDFEAFAQPVSREIAKHVGRIDLSRFMAPIGALAQKPIKGARGKKPKTELDFPRYVTLLEAVIFRETGIAMQIKASRPAGKGVSIDDLKVTYVHLGWIPPGTPGKSPLWDKAMETPDLLDGDDPAAVRLEVYTRLSLLGPEPFIWKTGRRHFRFSEEFVDSFKKVRASRKADLTKKLPEKGDAPKPDPTIKPPEADKYLNPSGQDKVSLLIGVHGGTSQVAKQAGLDRESHHTTQYLLVQFFRNENRVKAWRSGTPYAGLKATGRTGLELFQPATKKALELRSLDPGGVGNRGAMMPAILISADTHRRGQLHVEKESKWNGPAGDPDSDDSQGRATQGFAISAEWRRQQMTHLGTHDEAADWPTRMKQGGASDQLHAAMLGTYHWMHGQMMPALERGLETREHAYYRAIAARKPGAANRETGKLESKFDLKTTDLKAVYARARRNNDSVMAAAGWTAPS